MAKANIWVSPRPEGWAVHREHSERASHVVPTKEEAVNIARDMARQDRVELFIQRLDGTIQERNTYGNDPFPPRG